MVCAPGVPTAVTQTTGLSSSLNAYPQSLPFSFSPIANGSLSDLLQALDPQSFVPLNQLRYICYNDSLDGTSSLCDTWAQVSDTTDRLSVDPSGAYLTAATVFTSGGSLFLQDDIIINPAGSLSYTSAFPNAEAATDLRPYVLVFLAGGFACCMLGLAILVGLAHCRKVP